MPELAFFRHGEELLRVALTDRTTIGRAPSCDVSLPDPNLSRVQAALERRGDRFHLVDRSGRGTQVAGEVVHTAELGDGAEIAFGAWRALFRTSPGEAEERTNRERDTTTLRAAQAQGTPPPTPHRLQLRLRQSGRERLIRPEPHLDVLRIGKDGTNDVVIDDPFVSAHHLRLERRATGWLVRDLGSTNGTRLSGLRVTEAELPLGATLSLGDAELTLEPMPSGEGAPRLRVFEGMLSHEPCMRQVFELIGRVAPSCVPVAIFGETGTGKELVARALHHLSERHEAAFIPVNCSAIAESLIESELFGHERGAFSGAERLRRGAFEEAHGGTLFLDEIGELPLDLQPKLLRTLEQGEVKRVGASRPLTVDVRVIAATHRDLRARVRTGKFREDLYYRLCVVPISVPPLRRRRGDIRALAEHFLSRTAPRGLAPRFSEEALARLEAYDWPGNVRQLRNAVQRALLFRGEGLEIGAETIVFEDTRATPTTIDGDDDLLYVRGLSMEALEREAIRLSLRRHHGKRSAVVKELAIAKSTVMKRIAQWGLQREGREHGRKEELDATDSDD